MIVNINLYNNNGKRSTSLWMMPCCMYTQVIVPGNV
ncbi:hypothetical protein EV199_0443 [Pseudobacter ginsenosidimutans]|uniref:Uncharacterized protein n=1 Tax=Pseudobacter ginsenosidimutans TaxID=661488 RepID=A0A4Q7N1V8_9BACT|nr:hypothetical protein EV199_0443 [Pseudobacter ginsenosidimutans]